MQLCPTRCPISNNWDIDPIHNRSISSVSPSISFAISPGYAFHIRMQSQRIGNHRINTYHIMIHGLDSVVQGRDDAGHALDTAEHSGQQQFDGQKTKYPPANAAATGKPRSPMILRTSFILAPCLLQDLLPVFIHYQSRLNANKKKGPKALLVVSVTRYFLPYAVIKLQMMWLVLYVQRT